MNPDVKGFFDDATNTISYVISDPATRKAAVLDTVWDYEPNSGRTRFDSADRIIEFVGDNGLEVEWVLETHVHADHLSAAPYVQKRLGGKLGIGKDIVTVQDVFGKIFNVGTEFERDGSQFDHLFADGDRFTVGELEGRAIHTPGHTPACMTYVIGDAAFIGDTLFMPDFGTARCDFPGGSAETLYQSVQKIYALPDETRLFLCHDYKAPGRDEYKWESTVSEQKRLNVHINATSTEEAFVKMRTERDAGLDMPRLILPSVQVNMRAGCLPPEEDNGVSYLKMPVNVF